MQTVQANSSACHSSSVGWRLVTTSALANVLGDRVPVLGQQAAADPAQVEAAAAVLAEVAELQQAQLLLRAQRLAGLGVEGRGDHPLEEVLGHRLRPRRPSTGG